MTEIETTTKRGGARAGAGPKFKHSIPERGLKMRVTEEEMSIIKIGLPSDTRERSKLIVSLALAATMEPVEFQAQDVPADFVGIVTINGQEYYLLSKQPD